MKNLLITLMALTTLAQAAFVPPNEGPVPFRRDKLPVDVDTMVALSKQLLVLVGTTDVQDPASERRASQLLGVSLALDPTNRETLELTKRLKKGKAVEPSSPGEIRLAQSRVWHLMGWLEQPEAGVDGNALAACLADILVSVDPEHPRASELAGKGEQGNWDGWVASVDAFKDVAPVMVEKTVEPLPPSNNSVEVALKLRSGSVEVPLWYVDRETRELVFRPVALKMEARIDGGEEPALLKLPGRDQQLERKFGEQLKSFLEERHGQLPNGLQFHFQTAGDIRYTPVRNGNVLLGAILLLADSALSGEPSEGLVFVEPDRDGSLKLPPKFWQSIRRLADHQPGSRLILPSAAKAFMPPLITLDQSEFFFNFEVLMVDDVAGLCELASATPPEGVAEASAAFETVRNARGSRSLGSFLNLDSTQQRLKQVIALFPDHVSARMLALRGTSQWPKRLPRDIAAREIRAAIEPLGSYFKPGAWMTLKGEELESKVDASREQLASVDKLLGSVSDQRELLVPATNIAKDLGGLAVDAKRSRDDYSMRIEDEKAFREAWTDYLQVVELLTQAAGDLDEFPVPTAAPVE